VPVPKPNDWWNSSEPIGHALPKKMRGSSQVSIATSSFAIGALMDYISSPSSVGSYMSYDIPSMLISTGGRSMTQTQNDASGDHEDSKQLLWIKKPYGYKRSFLK